MKANELRIGNWVLSKDMPVQIEEIKPETIRYCFGEFSISYIEPINLTEEWLVKFGFSHISKNDYQSPYKFLIFDIKLLCFADIQDNNERIFSPIDVKYVHQLQNLYFSLTGEELEIK